MKIPLDTITALQSNPTSIRNICILAHVDHGKTSLSDSLLASNGIISQKLAGKVRFLDSRPDEQLRGITMEASAISLYFRVLKKQEGDEPLVSEHLINLIDSPGHVDFSLEVSTAARLCDGAVVVVDVVEGVCSQTVTVLRQAWLDNLKPILVLNKMDRLITELQLSPSEAHVHLNKLVEQVNSVLGTFFAGERMNDDLLWREGNEARARPAPFIDRSDDALYFSPALNNVVFASAIHGWGFSVSQFAKQYADRLGMKRENLQKVLWGNFYLEKGKVVKKPKAAAMPLFVSLILDPIWAVYAACAEGDLARVDRITASLKLAPRRGAPSARTLMSQWVPVSSAVLLAVVEQLPSPVAAQSGMNDLLRRGGAGADTADDLSRRDSGAANSLSRGADTADSLSRGITLCDRTAPVCAYVSKMVSVPVKELPRNIRGELLSEEFIERGRAARAAAKRASQAAQVAAEAEALITKAGATSGKGAKAARAAREAAEAEAQWDTPAASDRPVEAAAGVDEFVITSATGEVFEWDLLPPLEEEELIGFARVYSGTLTVGQTVAVVGPRYDPSRSATEFVSTATITELYLIMGRELVPLQSAPAGSIVGIGGLLGKVLKNGTLCAIEGVAGVAGAALAADTADAAPTALATDAAPDAADASLSPPSPPSPAAPAAPASPYLVNLAGVVAPSPILKVAVETVNPTHMPRLERGLRLLNEADPCVDVYLAENGEHILAVAGELHLERCVKDLRERFAGCEISVTEPVVPWRETILGAEDAAVGGETAPALVSGGYALTVRVAPLPPAATRFLTTHEPQLKRLKELGHTANAANVAAAAAGFAAITSELAGLGVKGAVAVGPKRVGPNVLVDSCGVLGLGAGSFPYRDSLLAGFHLAMNEGPLAAEAVRGVRVEVRAVPLPATAGDAAAGDAASGLAPGLAPGPLITATRDAIHAALLQSRPRIMLAMYTCSISATAAVLGKVYSVVQRRRGRILLEEMREGTPFFSVTARVPVVEAFGFSEELRKQTSGAAAPQLVFDGFEEVEEDPFWEEGAGARDEDEGAGAGGAAGAGRARRYVDAVRARKGLFVEKKVVESAEKQRTLKKD